MHGWLVVLVDGCGGESVRRWGELREVARRCYEDQYRRQSEVDLLWLGWCHQRKWLAAFQL